MPLLAIDVARAREMMSFRDDFALEQPMSRLLDQLESAVPSGGGLQLPEDGGRAQLRREDVTGSKYDGDDVGFDYLIKTQNKLLFKFSDHDEELSDEMLTINHNKSILNVGKFIYEFFILKIPIKRLHPSLKNEDNIDNFVYSTTKDEQRIDPRLELLKKLKK